RAQLRQGGRLTPVIPILLYHGRRRWKYRTLAQLFGGLEADLLGFLPDFDYVYHNLRDAPEETIKAVGNQFLASALLMLKYGTDRQLLKAKLPEILSLGLSHGSEGQQVVLAVYGFELVDYTEEEIRMILDRLPTEIKDKVMSTYELLIEKGRNEERARAQRLIEMERAKVEQERARVEQERARAYQEKLDMARDMKKDGVSNERIAKFSKLPIEVIEKL